MLKSRYELPNDRTLNRVLSLRAKSSRGALDIGAYVGDTAVLLSPLVRGMVYAFEPFPDTYAELVENAKSFSNIVCINKAVSNKTGASKLYVDLLFPADNMLAYSYGRNTVDIETTTLDDWYFNYICSSCGALPTIDLVKMDIQGGEVDALYGGKEMFKKLRPTIIVEFAPFHIKKHGREPREIFEFLYKMCYTVRDINEQVGEPIDIKDLRLFIAYYMDTGFHTNLLCTRRKSNEHIMVRGL